MVTMTWTYGFGAACDLARPRTAPTTVNHKGTTLSAAGLDITVVPFGSGHLRCWGPPV